MSIYKQYTKLAYLYKKSEEPDLEEIKNKWKNSWIGQIAPKELWTDVNTFASKYKDIEKMQRMIYGGGLGALAGGLLKGKKGAIVGGLIGTGLPYFLKGGPNLENLLGENNIENNIENSN